MTASQVPQAPQASSSQFPRPDILAYLLHISFNFWADNPAADQLWGLEHVAARPYLRCEDTLWQELTTTLAQRGFNMVVLDLGDGIRYESHPEIAVENAWSVERLRQEIARLRGLGLEPIPKLNFSTAHDAWLGEYARMVSTPRHYEVCRDLIGEVIDIFDTPRLFHLGMDEETYHHQRFYRYSQVRQFDLWWEDLFFYVNEVERRGVRAWVWADYAWQHPETYFAKMPRSVLQSNWYYGEAFGDDIVASRNYRELAERGYDQVATASNWTTPTNFASTVAYCHQHAAAPQLLGFMQTVWRPTVAAWRKRHVDAIDLVSAVWPPVAS